MYSFEIDREIRARNWVIPVWLYVDICRSPQVDHVKRDGDWTDIWTRDGAHWRVRVEKS